MSTIPEALAVGWTSYHAGDFPGAERIFRQVLEVDPAAAQAWYLLGTVIQVQGKLGEAVAHYQQALRLEPDFAEVLNNLAVALQSQGKVDEATACLRRAVQLKPDYADAHSNLGNALQFDGKLNEAEACYRYALAAQDGQSGYPSQSGQLAASDRLPGRGDDVL